jgi:hypothetical protein
MLEIQIPLSQFPVMSQKCMIYIYFINMKKWRSVVLVETIGKSRENHRHSEIPIKSFKCVSLNVQSGYVFI